VRDFDKARQVRLDRDRTFQIGGETFSFRPAVAPEALLEYNSAITGDLTDLKENDWIRIYDDTIIAMLEDGQGDRWHHARRLDSDNPLNADDINAVLQWILEQVTGHPTGQPSDSSTSSDGNGTPSKDNSSEPEATPTPSPSETPATSPTA